MEGIHFTDVNAETDQAGIKVFMGYWITPDLGFEAGVASLGEVPATFNYSLPPSETGTGNTTVSVSNFSMGLQFAHR
jgi:hypothetical protein